MLCTVTRSCPSTRGGLRLPRTVTVFPADDFTTLALVGACMAAVSNRVVSTMVRMVSRVSTTESIFTSKGAMSRVSNPWGRMGVQSFWPLTKRHSSKLPVARRKLSVWRLARNLPVESIAAGMPSRVIWLPTGAEDLTTTGTLFGVVLVVAIAESTLAAKTSAPAQASNIRQNIVRFIECTRRMVCVSMFSTRIEILRGSDSEILQRRLLEKVG